MKVYVQLIVYCLYRNFPNCRFAERCLYVHPDCKFDAVCTRPSCPFTHSAKKSPGGSFMQRLPPPVVLQPINSKH